MKDKLPENTRIEVIAIKGEKIFKTIKTLKEAMKMKKAKGFSYMYFQLGYSQFKNVIEK